MKKGIKTTLYKTKKHMEETLIEAFAFSDAIDSGNLETRISDAVSSVGNLTEGCWRVRRGQIYYDRTALSEKGGKSSLIHIILK